MGVLLSWSGGKDSALALARLREQGHADVTLAHLTDAATRRDRAHGVPDFVVQEQASALGLPLKLEATDLAGYEAGLLQIVAAVQPDAIAFGDVNLEEHRAWGEALARKANVDAAWPLWNEPTREVANEAIRRGFRAFVVACRPPLDASFLGRFVDAAFIEDVEALDVDPAGENGEYHTLAVDGPGFRRRVDAMAGEPREAPHGGWWLEVGIRGC